jgi:hypothetical protein
VRGRAAAAAAGGSGGLPSRAPAVVSITGRVYPVQVSPCVGTVLELLVQ